MSDKENKKNNGVYSPLEKRIQEEIWNTVFNKYFKKQNNYTLT